MLEINDAAFAKASHAYGKAKDVPELLRGLTAKSEKERARALEQLGASICHQGTLYTATPLAVPHLLELVASPKVKDRAGILHLLADIVTLDDHERFLLAGDPSKLPSDLPATFRKSILAVQKGAPVIAKLLTDKEAEVRSVAAFLLSWLPREHAPHVAEALAKEKDDAVKTSMVLALGFLDPKASFDKELKAKHVGLRTAAALATSTVKRGDIDDKTRGIIEKAAAKRSLKVDGLLFCGGDLASFAVQVAAAIGADLVDAIEAGGAGAMYAANVMVRRLFEEQGPAPKPNHQVARRDQEDARALAELPIKLDELDETQRAFIDALAKIDGGFDNDLTEALGQRGLPSTKELMVRWVAGATTANESILDRACAGSTLGDLYVKATRKHGDPDPAVIEAIEAATTVDERIAVAVEGLEQVEVSWSMGVAFELLWRNAPQASKESMKAVEKLAENGHLDAVAAGIALAARALAAKKPADPSVDELLQQTYGFWSLTKRALAALPVARREKWLLDPKRDDQAQPAEFFTGAWRYFGACPTKAIADRALAHVARWKPKDPWGQPRGLYGEPRLKELAAEFRAAGNVEDAKRLEAALAALK